MIKSGYSESKNVRDVLLYLSDLKEARSKGIDILKQRDIRIQALKKEREAQAAKKEKQKIAYAKKYPYYAVLSCEANGSHLNIASCLSGGQYGADTDFTSMEKSIRHIISIRWVKKVQRVCLLI